MIDTIRFLHALRGQPDGEMTMTKNEIREVNDARFACELGMSDVASRILSVIYRAGSKKTQSEIILIANDLGLIGHPEFIIRG